MTRIGGVRTKGRAAIELARTTELTFLAAGIAYYALVSVFPALLLAITVAAILGGDELVAQVMAATNSYLTPSGQEAVASGITSARERSGARSGATAVGLLALLWSTLKVFRGMDTAFSRVYGTTTVASLLEQLRDALTVVGTIGMGIVAMFAVGTGLAVLDPPGSTFVGFGLLLVGLFVVFLPLYYVFPDTDVRFAEVVPGAAVAAVGWVVLQSLFQLYTDVAGGFQIYGVIGGVLLLVTWFYFAAILLLFGGVVNVVVAGRDREESAATTSRASTEVNDDHG